MDLSRIDLSRRNIIEYKDVPYLQVCFNFSEINDLYNSKRKLFADFKQHETDYNRLQKEHKKVQSRKKEEEKRAKEMAYRKEM